MDSSVKNQHRNTYSIFWKPKKICCSLLALLILVILILLILGLTVFKPKDAITTVDSVDLDGMRVSLDVARLSVDVNVSLGIDLTVKNPNHASFKYGNSSAFLYYREILVGEVAIPAGKISAGETKGMNLTLVIMADQLLSDSKLYSDIVAGTLSMKTSTRISGRVSVLNLFKHHVVSYTNCNVTIDVSSQKIENSNCEYRTKL